MTDSDLIKLKPDDLVVALNDKEVVTQLRKDSGLLSHVMDTLTEKVLAEAFVKNKFAPKEAVMKYPLSFIDQFIECNFNPGIDGIIDLCSVSDTAKIDRSISKLLTTFTSNKYDAVFIRSIMNLSSAKDGLVVTETLSVLMQTSGVALILLNDLKEKNPDAFLSVVVGLKGEIKTESASLMDEDFASTLRGNEDQLLRLFKLIFEMKMEGLFLGSAGDPFVSLFTKKTAYHKITDEEAIYFLSVVKEDSLKNYSKFAYRKIFEELPRSRKYAHVLTDVPRDSRFFISSFIQGEATLSALDAFALLQGHPRKELFHSVLHSGEDSEIANLIKSNPDRLTMAIEGSHITPAVLRDAIGRERPLVAKVILELVGSDFRKQIHSNYPDFKVASDKISVGEKHKQICDLIQGEDGEGFNDEILTYHAGVNSLTGNVLKFIARHEQPTYEKTYEHLNLSFKFLASLENEETAMLLILSKIKVGSSYDSKKPFLSAKNAFEVLSEDKDDESGALKMTYDKNKFLDMLNENQLSKLHISNNQYDDDDNLIKMPTDPSQIHAAKLLAKKVKENPPSKRIKLESDDILAQVALLLTKNECVKAFVCDPFEDYNCHYDLVFKGGDRYTAKDILKSAQKVTGRVDDVLTALQSIEAKEELREVCLAIVAPKATQFSDLFPAAGNRSSSLRDSAVKILASLDPTFVNVGDILKKTKHLSALSKTLGDDCIDLLLKNEPKRMPALILDSSTPEITKGNLEELLKKYTIQVPSVLIDTQKDVKRLKYYLDLGIEVGPIDLSKIKDLSLDTKKALVIDTVTMCLTKDGVKMYFGDNLLEAALLEGCSDILKGHDLLALQDKVDDFDAFKLAHKLNIPMSASLDIAKRVCTNSDMLKFAVKNGIRFDNLIVVVQDYYIRNVKDMVELAHSIGLTAVTEVEFRCLTVYSHVFDANGSLKAFSPMSLKSLQMSDRVELIRLLSEKNPKYKKLLGQNLGSDLFVLNPPELLDKSLFSLVNLKDLLGFGPPGDLSKEEKDALSDLLTANSSLISLAVSHFKQFLALASLNEVRFEDIFTRANGKLVTSEFAIFMAADYEHPGDESEQVFSSVLKSPSKLELLGLLKDGDEYTISFLKDSVSTMAEIRKDMNEFIAVLGEENLSANMIFSAMAGDNSSNALLDERMTKNDDNADMLKDLSNAIKVVTVTLSIARKQIKAGDSVNLARVLHDTLGGLIETVSTIMGTKGKEKEKKMKSGFEKFNKELSSEKMAVKSKKNAKLYTLYFPESLGEVQSIGADMSLCTKWDNSYFKNTVGGTAVLFNLKEEDKIIAQGYTVKKDGSWIMSQFHYSGNHSATEDFDSYSLIEMIKGLIKRDKKLSERYIL